MKKFGFTLAEILISLGIIGVISALTMPTLFTNTSNAKIGPTLAKAVSAFEQANMMMLNDAEADSLEDAGMLSPDDNMMQDGIMIPYLDRLQNFLKGTRIGSESFLSKDGVRYTIKTNITDSNTLRVALNSSTIPHQDALGIVTIVIDNNTPQEDGINRFYFSFFNDGSLRPAGATGWIGNGQPASASASTHWNYTGSEGNNCPLNAPVGNAKYCAGHIFENNLKVNYKFTNYSIANPEQNIANPEQTEQNLDAF